jgi:heme/copper-type cytochrome/quinol oxidase subunit 1
MSQLFRFMATYRKFWLAPIIVCLILLGVLLIVYNCLTSLRSGRVAGDDPWQANTLEWYTSSPPPPHNFDSLPPIRSERPLADLRAEAAEAAGVTR